MRSSGGLPCFEEQRRKQTLGLMMCLSNGTLIQSDSLFFPLSYMEKCIIYQVIIQTQLISLTCVSDEDPKEKFSTSIRVINSILQAELNMLLGGHGQGHTNTAFLLMHFVTFLLVTKATC